MKNQNQQQEAVKGFVQVTDIESEKTQIRGRAKKTPGIKRPTARKSVRKTSTATGVETPRKAPKNTARKSVSRFMNEGTLFRDSFNDVPFGHDDFQLRQEMEIDHFSDEDVANAFTMETSRNLPMELEEEGHGTYSDQQLVQEIRRAVERDSAVSSAAQKIQLTAKNGVVILKGTVSSEQEQMIIEDKAVALAGFGQVVNQLEVIEDIIE